MSAPAESEQHLSADRTLTLRGVDGSIGQDRRGDLWVHFTTRWKTGPPPRECALCGMSARNGWARLDRGELIVLCERHVRVRGEES